MPERPARTLEIRGRIVTGQEVRPQGAVLVEGGRIEEVSYGPPRAEEVHEYPGGLVAPGFVDLQVNGSSGIDVAAETWRVPELSERLTAAGTTSYLPTLISSPMALYREALPRLASLVNENFPGGAEVLGAHLEGPFIDPGRGGAHPVDCVTPPDAGLLGELLDMGPVRLLTLAPELKGAAELVEAARKRGVVVSAGHSNAAFDAGCAAFDRGVESVTHLFNAMSPLHHREPGLAGAALAHPRVSCGIIADGRHVHPEVVALAFKVLGPDRLYLVTDATSAAGAGPGEYRLGTRGIRSDGNAPVLEDGTLAGSVLAMDEALRNAVSFTGCTIPEVVRMASTTPARLVGEGGRKGRLAPGYVADVVVLGPELCVEAVYRGGSLAYPAGA